MIGDELFLIFCIRWSTFTYFCFDRDTSVQHILWVVILIFVFFFTSGFISVFVIFLSKLRTWAFLVILLIIFPIGDQTVIIGKDSSVRSLIVHDSLFFWWEERRHLFMTELLLARLWFILILKEIISQLIIRSRILIIWVVFIVFWNVDVFVVIIVLLSLKRLLLIWYFL